MRGVQQENLFLTLQQIKERRNYTALLVSCHGSSSTTKTDAVNSGESTSNVAIQIVSGGTAMKSPEPQFVTFSAVEQGLLFILDPTTSACKFLERS